MTIKGKSYFKDGLKDLAHFENWIKQLESANGRVYPEEGCGPLWF